MSQFTITTAMNVPVDPDYCPAENFEEFDKEGINALITVRMLRHSNGGAPGVLKRCRAKNIDNKEFMVRYLKLSKDPETMPDKACAVLKAMFGVYS